jgi:Cytochrome C'
MRILLLLLLAGAAIAQAPSSYKPYASLADIMAGISLPKSNSVFDVTKRAPQNDTEWIAVQTDAAVLAEVGNLILTPGRLKENGQPVPRTADFRRHVQALVEAAKDARKAALQKDADAVFVACEPLYQACYSCHQAYRFCSTCQEAEAH